MNLVKIFFKCLELTNMSSFLLLGKQTFYSFSTAVEFVPPPPKLEEDAIPMIEELDSLQEQYQAK